MRLALGELEALAGAGTTGLFALLHAGIAGEETLLLELGAEGFVDFDKCAAEGEAQGAGLAVDSAAGGFGGDIVAVNRVGDFQRTEDLVLKRETAEVVGKIAAIDLNGAGSGLHANAGNGSFTATCRLDWVFCFAHGNKNQAGCGFCAVCGCSLPA